MIQRIQTLYLLVISILMILTSLLPLAFFSGGGQVVNLYSRGLYTPAGEVVQFMPYMLVITIITAVMPLVIIFLYKNRITQIRLCVTQIVLLFGVVVLLGVYFYLSYRSYAQFSDMSYGVHPAVAAPVIAIILNFMAVNAIVKDEALVRSLDRIR
ncbi:MAG: DUF4293 domain-containing protein [Rikenellaceae bacterium]